MIALGLHDGRTLYAVPFQARQKRAEGIFIGHDQDNGPGALGERLATPQRVERSTLASGVGDLSFPNTIREVAPKHDVVKQNGVSGPLSS